MCEKDAPIDLINAKVTFVRSSILCCKYFLIFYIFLTFFFLFLRVLSKILKGALFLIKAIPENLTALCSVTFLFTKLSVLTWIKIEIFERAIYYVSISKIN